MTAPSSLGDDAPASQLPVEVHAEAQAEADRYFGDGPIAPWRPEGAQAAAARWPWLAGGGGLLFIVAVVAALVPMLREPAAPVVRGAKAPLPVMAFTQRAPLGNPDDDIIDEPLPAPPAARPAAVVPAGGEQLAITRRGREWRIEANGAARLLVAQRLAGASGSSLRGDVASLASARPLDLTWRGRSTADAWRAVLGPGQSFVTQCSGSRCQVWLLQAGEPGVAAIVRPVIPMPSIEPVVAVAAPVKQSDSPDPRVAAHHD